MRRWNSEMDANKIVSYTSLKYWTRITTWTNIFWERYENTLKVWESLWSPCFLNPWWLFTSPGRNQISSTICVQKQSNNCSRNCSDRVKTQQWFALGYDNTIENTPFPIISFSYSLGLHIKVTNYLLIQCMYQLDERLLVHTNM